MSPHLVSFAHCGSSSKGCNVNFSLHGAEWDQRTTHLSCRSWKMAQSHGAEPSWKAAKLCVGRTDPPPLLPDLLEFPLTLHQEPRKEK